MSVRAEFLRIGIRMLLKRRGGNLDVEQWRRNMRAMERFVPRPPARSATVKLEAGRVTLHRVTTPASRRGCRLVALDRSGSDRPLLENECSGRSDAERRGSARLGETLSRRNRSAHAPRFAALWRSRRIAAGAYSGGQR